MKRTIPIVAAVFGLLLVAGATTPAQAQPRIPPIAHPGGSMTQHARGPFDVKLSPQKPDNAPAERAGLARMALDKQFHGDLEASSQGEMLAAGTQVKGSAGYVAIERVTGTLHGRSGSFVLQHSGTMNRGEPTLSVSVVPDSGTDELAGLSGSMKIIIADGGKHSYEFEYALAETR